MYSIKCKNISNYRDLKKIKKGIKKEKKLIWLYKNTAKQLNNFGKIWYFTVIEMYCIIARIKLVEWFCNVVDRKKIVFKYLITILTYQIYPQTIGKD